MKTKLRIEELRVDTFVVSRAEAARGTVHAHDESAPPYPCASGVWSCLDSCQDTCGLSCNGSCVNTVDPCCQDG